MRLEKKKFFFIPTTNVLVTIKKHYSYYSVHPITGRKIITGKRPFLTEVIAQPGLSTATGYPCPNRTNMLKSSTQSNQGELVTGSGGV